MQLSDDRLSRFYYCPHSKNFYYQFREHLFVIGHWMKAENRHGVDLPARIQPTNWNFKYKLFWIDEKPWRNNTKTERRFPLCRINDLPDTVEDLWEAMIGSEREKAWVQHCDDAEKKYWREFNFLAEREAERFHRERGTKIESDTESEEGTA
jgi:hypothetical protein